MSTAQPAVGYGSALEPNSTEQPVGRRKHNPGNARAELLDVATEEFARVGYHGARVDEIAARSSTTKRMIYYYFGSKEGLFVAVLEEAYRRFDEAEAALELDRDRPVEALMVIIGFVFAYYRANPEFVTLLNSENLHRGKHISKSRRAGEYSSPALAVLGQVLRSGVEQKLFRADVSTRDVYLLIASTGYFYQSNRYTLSAFFGEDMGNPDVAAQWEAFVKQVVLRTVMIDAGSPRRS